MLIDYSHIAAESEFRRARLLADAEAFRLARSVRRVRRPRRRGTPPEVAPPPERDRCVPISRDDAPDRRCAVPR